MMSVAVDVASWALIVTGSLFAMSGGIGVLRLPDVYTRSHAAGITDTMTAGSILVGLMLQAGYSQVTVKLVLILVFMIFTSPTATHALIHAAHASGLKPVLADAEPASAEHEPSKTS